MQQALVKTAIEFAKNKTVQRTAIGFVVGAAVGFAIAKTTEPYLFPEPQYEMIPPYDTPDQAIERHEFEHEHIIPVKYEGASIGHVTSTTADETGVTVTAKINPDAFKGQLEQNSGVEIANKIIASTMPRPKYAKPVHAAAVAPTVQPATGVEKLAALKETNKQPVSTFSSTRGLSSTNTGGGNPHKKVRPIDTGE